MVDVSNITTIDSEILGDQTPTRWMPSPWVMWSVAVLFVFFQFFIQLSSGVMFGQLVVSFHTTALGAGILAGSFYVVYMILQTPAGMLVDRFGPRRLLAGGGFVCALGAYLFATSQVIYVAELGRILMGAGSSFAYVSSLYIAARWFPARRFGFMVGLAETIGMLGTLLGNVYLAHLLQTVPWRHAMMVATGVAMIIGCLCWSLIRDQQQVEQTQQSPAEFMQDIIYILKQSGLWLNGIISSIFFSLLTVFAGLWCIPFFIMIYHVPLTTATLTSSMLYIGLAIGCPLLGLVYPMVTRPRWLLFSTALVAAVLTTIVIYFSPKDIVVTGSLMFILGIVTSAYVVNFALVKELSPTSVVSTSVGFTNMLCVMSAPLLQPLLGWIIEATSGRQLTGATVHYTVPGFHWALAIFPLLLIIAAGLSRLIPRDKPGS